ncbi:MAG TPA: YHYH protein [Candidatus Lustribacter sp.]|nr:YHYH protein [Candidatus Lustribacter sp.]
MKHCLVFVLGIAICSAGSGRAAAASSYTCPVASTSSGPLNCAALPLGDSRYSTSGPAVGSVYVCAVPRGQAPPGTGPWIDMARGTWDALSKDVVSGSVSWSGTFRAVRSGSSLAVSGNGLPLTPITSGTFPIGSADGAYRYDRNPNHIAAQAINYALPYNPSPAASPGCLGQGRIGMALDGVSVFNAFDAIGHDAVAREGQDICHGHPQQSGVYHYHGWLQACVADAGSATQNSSLLGYALDGYGIYGPWYGGKVLTSADLDACHGTTSVVTWHGAPTSIYHYVSTYDFPYTLGCYHGTPVPA